MFGVAVRGVGDTGRTGPKLVVIEMDPVVGDVGESAAEKLYWADMMSFPIARDSATLPYADQGPWS
jgi:hypothetical protein